MGGGVPDCQSCLSLLRKLSGFRHEKSVAWDRAGRDPAAAAMMSTSAQGSLRVLHSFGSHRGARCSAPRCTRPSKLKGCRVRCRGEEEKLSDVQSAWLDVSLLPILATLPAVSAFAANAMDAADSLSATTTTYLLPWTLAMAGRSSWC